MRPSDEFNHAGTPPEAWKRHHLYLTEQGSGSVLTDGMKAPGASGQQDRKGGDPAAGAFETQMMIQAARLADPAYQAMSARINGDLDRMDGEAVEALQNIEHELLALRREREQLLEQAYRGGQGRAVAMTEDGTAAYYITDDGTGDRLDDEEFQRIKDDLIDRSSVEDFADVDRKYDELSTRGDQIRAGMEDGDQFRDDLATGAISAEEAEQRAEEIQETMAAIVGDAEAAILGARSDLSAPDTGATFHHEGPQVPDSVVIPLTPR